ncbi:hypothetical protein ASG03_18845 [Rhizobium sp. Leaf341]|nr:hypothetical protein ASG03_18845 [Rhizobium sp. Leaf341]
MAAMRGRWRSAGPVSRDFPLLFRVPRRDTIAACMRHLRRLSAGERAKKGRSFRAVFTLSGKSFE